MQRLTVDKCVFHLKWLPQKPSCSSESDANSLAPNSQAGGLLPVATSAPGCWIRGDGGRGVPPEPPDSSEGQPLEEDWEREGLVLPYMLWETKSRKNASLNTREIMNRPGPLFSLKGQVGGLGVCVRPCGLKHWPSGSQTRPQPQVLH